MELAQKLEAEGKYIWAEPFGVVTCKHLPLSSCFWPGY